MVHENAAFDIREPLLIQPMVTIWMVFRFIPILNILKANAALIILSRGPGLLKF